jgi:hypothetical protein
MFAAIVLTILVTALVGICGVVDHCYATLPKQYHMANARLIWFTVTAFVLVIGANILADRAPVAAGLLFLFALAQFFLFRGIAFIGLERSFVVYGRDNEMLMPAIGALLAWAASSCDVLAVLGIVAKAIMQIVQTGALSKSDMIGYDAAIRIVMACSLFLTIAFLWVMCGNMNRVNERNKQERKRKLDESKRAPRKPRTPPGSAQAD